MEPPVLLWAGEVDVGVQSVGDGQVLVPFRLVPWVYAEHIVDERRNVVGTSRC